MAKSRKTEPDKYTRVTLFWDKAEYPEVEELYQNCNRGEFNQLFLDTIAPRAEKNSLAAVVKRLNQLAAETRRLYDRFKNGDITFEEAQQEVEQIEDTTQAELLGNLLGTAG